MRDFDASYSVGATIANIDTIYAYFDGSNSNGETKMALTFNDNQT